MLVFGLERFPNLEVLFRLEFEIPQLTHGPQADVG